MSLGELFMGFLGCLFMALLLYLQAHINEEMKTGKSKRLFWEKKNEK